MSFHAVDWVLKHSQAEHAERLVLFALANHASTDKSIAFPSVETLCEEARLSRRAVQGAIRRLLALGEIVEVGKTRFGTRCFQLPCTPADSAPAQDLRPGRKRREGAQDLPLPRAGSAPESSRNGKKSSERARGKRVTYEGKRVPEDTVDVALRLLAHFNEAAGRNYGAWKATGLASDRLKKVIGGLLSRPEVTTEEWETAIVNTVANPMSFVEGPVELGHIFGPNAADHALSNPGRALASGPGAVSRRTTCRNCGEELKPDEVVDCRGCRRAIDERNTGVAA